MTDILGDERVFKIVHECEIPSCFGNSIDTGNGFYIFYKDGTYWYSAWPKYRLGCWKLVDGRLFFDTYGELDNMRESRTEHGLALADVLSAEVAINEVLTKHDNS